MGRRGSAAEEIPHASFDFQFYPMKYFVDQNYIVLYHYVLSMAVMNRKTIALIAILLIIGIGLVVGLWYLQSPPKRYTGQHVLLHAAWIGRRGIMRDRNHAHH